MIRRARSLPGSSLSRGSPGADDIGYFCHGTTVGTNALLEGKGVRTGLLVTEGFRGIYPVGEQARPYGTAIFDVMYDKPALVPPRRTGEVKERIDFRGDVLRTLDEAALRETVRELKAQNIESIAVCLLFSFLHPEHEARVREIVLEEIPGCSVSLSCEVLPQIREYYRLSTTVINAYLQPILARYIAQLDQRLAGAASPPGRNTSCSRMAAWRRLPPPRAAPSPPCCRGRPAASRRACSPAA